MPRRLGFLLIASVLPLLLPPPWLPGAGVARADARKKSAGGCPKDLPRAEGLRIWTAPASPIAGGRLRVMVVSERSESLGPVAGGAAADLPSARLAMVAPDGHRQDLSAVRRGGPPFGFDASVSLGAAGPYALEWWRGNELVACHGVEVGRPGGARLPAGSGRAPSHGAWATTRAWDRDSETFYAAWIESLFDAPVTENLGFRPLAQALRDRDRNFLFDDLGLGEDGPPGSAPGKPDKSTKSGKSGKTALTAEPDCADLPYFLRAYFSWKMGLPFGMRDCDRGTESRPPRCHELITNETPLPGAAPPPGSLEAMKRFLRLLANKVHSGSARTALTDDDTDTYPVPLNRAALRPGTIFADPYGHVLMVVHWVDQTSDASGGASGPAASGGGGSGMLLAVDGQPDNSIGRKRFWEGTFLYANDVVGAGPGFKAFRPLVAAPDGKLTPLTNAALAHDARFAPFSAEQAGLDRDRFYARMSQVIHPRGLAPASAYGETLDALVEQLTTRVGSVDNGEKFMRENHAPVVPMPEGPKIFETVGPWEDYATPSRDLRLLIAIHVLESLPQRIVSHPETFNLGGESPLAARAAIERLHATSIKARDITYLRSDGTPQKLTVADIVARKVGLEMAYNPNDCVELRWGAPAGSAEAASCKRHAPADQRARMEQDRSWFHDMRRPAR